MNIFKKLLALTMAGVLICGAAACPAPVRQKAPLQKPPSKPSPPRRLPLKPLPPRKPACAPW